MKKIITIVFTLISIFSFSDTILTDMQATYTLTSVLTQNTGLKVKSVFETSKSMASNQYESFKQKDFSLNKYKDIVAVVDIKSIWNDEALYNFARQENIRVVEIDASNSFEDNSSLVIPLLTKKNNNYNEFIWLNFNNTKKMLKIISSDLIKLYPNKKKIISKNLNDALNKIKNIELKYLEINDINGAIILSEDIAYLLDYLNIPYIYVENREEITNVIENTGYNLVLTDKGEKKSFKDSLKKYKANLITIQTGKFPVEDKDDEDLMSKNGLFEIYENNLKKLKNINNK
ncbi:metal ABC transporter solute-binding protein, Zn/Mn family [Oceanivirga salmonicida]|uniref:metal ABC transporter solute-binding protein, Zn/Mn family n=1 Tax=Oceanivirga salmonicida TaxID=1769291 RepID=UPI00082F11EF|nr:zinc ABC transporter substrate-binding protein [Oceanivirga salmonicida]